VAEHGMIEFMAFWLSFYLVNKKFGPVLAKYADKQNEVSVGWFQLLAFTFI